MIAIDIKVGIMAKSVRGAKGRYASAVGRVVPLSHAPVVSARVPDEIFAELSQMSSGDRGDFIRAAIAEKLERDSTQSRVLS